MTLRSDCRLTQRVLDRHTQCIICSTRCLPHTPGFVTNGRSGERMSFYTARSAYPSPSRCPHQSCALKMRKIVLQNNLPEAAVSNCSKATFYSITSSAMASSVGGTSRGIRKTGLMEYRARVEDHSPLTPAARITLPHFSVNSTMNLL